MPALGASQGALQLQTQPLFALALAGKPASIIARAVLALSTGDGDLLQVGFKNAAPAVGTAIAI